MLQQRVLLALPSPDSSSPQQQHSKHNRQPHLPNLICTPRYWDEPCAIRSRCVPYIDEESRHRVAPRRLQKGAFAAERGRGPIGADSSQRAQRPTTKPHTIYHHSSQVNRTAKKKGNKEGRKQKRGARNRNGEGAVRVMLGTTLGAHGF